MDKKDKIYIAGHGGLVGSAITRRLKADGFSNLITRTKDELNLLDTSAVAKFFQTEKPQYVFDAAAKVGGIMANKNYPAQFIFENLTIQNNLIECSYKSGVRKLLFLGSSCIYPKFADQPISEKSLLAGELEPTNLSYAVAKIAGIVMCQSYNAQYGTDFISLMPTNLYGPNDNFDLENSHVLPALIRKFHEAKTQNLSEVSVWGTGAARREFMHVDDLADATLFLMQNYSSSEIINVGTGEDISIKEIVETIKEIIGWNGRVVWDTSKPDGTPRKLLDINKIKNLGWSAQIGLRDGIEQTYNWYKKHVNP